MSILDRFIDLSWVVSDAIAGAHPKKHKAFKRPQSQLDSFRKLTSAPAKKRRAKGKKKPTKKHNYGLQYLDDTISFYNDKGGRYV